MSRTIILTFGEMPRTLSMPVHDAMVAGGLTPEIVPVQGPKLTELVNALSECNQMAVGFRLADSEALSLYRDAIESVLNIDPESVAYMLISTRYTSFTQPTYPPSVNEHIALDALAACHIGIELDAARNHHGQEFYLAADGRCGTASEIVTSDLPSQPRSGRMTEEIRETLWAILDDDDAKAPVAAKAAAEETTS
jgi:hypothetical protein